MKAIMKKTDELLMLIDEKISKPSDKNEIMNRMIELQGLVADLISEVSPTCVICEKKMRGPLGAKTCGDDECKKKHKYLTKLKWLEKNKEEGENNNG